MNSKRDSSGEELDVKIIPFGPAPQVIDRVLRGLEKTAAVRKYLKDTRHRLLYFELADDENSFEAVAEGKKKPLRPSPPSRFRATFFDYTNNRTIFVDGSLKKPSVVKVTESGLQPLPTPEEFEEAVRILMNDKEMAAVIAERQLKPYQPMPPLADIESPDGRTERAINVGFLPPTREDLRDHTIVAVNMISLKVIRFDNNAPTNAAANDTAICGLDYANQPTASRLAGGQVWVTVTQGGKVIWKFLAVRPAASSGTNGSGIELRYVDYRGKRVLYRAHVPILNVKYDNNACGPYRDWQNQESMIQANGTDIGSTGFRLCPTPAKTILDTGSDVGNFLGVAIYVQGQEVVLVSEMQAGWYRYISQWRLHSDGTIRPRFGFTAVQNSCVCHVHHHHAYWRFDFDIRTAGNNRVREFNNPPLFPPSNWHNKNFEIRRPRDPARKRKWRVENISTGEAYEIIPGPNDGVATSSPDWPFPRGDVWILHYGGGSEIDDGTVAIGPPYEADLDRFVNGEPINGQDVVVWYGAHFTHDVHADPPGTFGHIVGPDLKPSNW